MDDTPGEGDDNSQNPQEVLNPRLKRARTSVKQFPILDEYPGESKNPLKRVSKKPSKKLSEGPPKESRGRGRPRKLNLPTSSKDTSSTSASRQSITTNSSRRKVFTAISSKDVFESEIQIIEESIRSSRITENIKRIKSLDNEQQDESPELEIIGTIGIPVHEDYWHESSDFSEEIQILDTPEKLSAQKEMQESNKTYRMECNSADSQNSFGSDLIIIGGSPLQEVTISSSLHNSSSSSDSSVQIIETSEKQCTQSSDYPMEPHIEDLEPASTSKSLDLPEVITLSSSQSFDNSDSWDIVARLSPHENKTSRKSPTLEEARENGCPDENRTSRNEESVKRNFIEAFSNEPTTSRVTRSARKTDNAPTTSSNCKSPSRRLTRASACLSQKAPVCVQPNSERYKQCSVAPEIPKIKKVRQTEPKQKEKKANADPTTKKKKAVPKLWKEYVPMVNIFSESATRVKEEEIEASVNKYMAMYNKIHDENSKRVQDEVNDEFADWLNADPFAGQTTSSFSIDVSKAKITGEQKVTVNGVGFTVPVTTIEGGDAGPRMEHYMPIEMNFKGVDKPRLTNIPFFDESQNDHELFEQYTKLFPDGIHGFAKNYQNINDYLLYRMLRKSLEAHQADENPDLVYYCIYRLFPNKLGQRGLSDKFPSLCERFAEKDFDPMTLEPWKKSLKTQVAPNLSNMQCFSCLEHLCLVHGFRKEVPDNFPGGEYDKVSLPLRDSQSDVYCSEECWRHIPSQEVSEVLRPTDQEISDGRVDIYLLKSHFLKMEIEDGSFIAISYAKEKYMEGKFCEFVAQTLDPLVTGPKVSTCKQTYEFIMKEGQRLSEAKRELLGEAVKEQRDHKTRSLAFRRRQESRARQRIKKKFQVQIDEAVAKGIDPKTLKKEYADACKNTQLVLMPVVPLVPCRHDGQCNEETEGCSCRENGICTYLCQCDVNCAQRFPGCVCSHGQCGTKNCMCFRANWECSPATCRSCGCDDVDGTGTGCRNYAMTRMAHKKTKVQPSKIAGYGLFLMEPCSKGELITEYVGECITDEEAERRGAINDRNKLSYIFALQTGGAIDAHNAGNNSRFANHNAKSPNMDAKTMVIAGEVRIGMYAKKDLKADTELTFDYRYSVEHQKLFKSSTVKNVPNRIESFPVI